MDTWPEENGNTKVLSQGPGYIVGGRAKKPVCPKLSERERDVGGKVKCARLHNAL